MRQGWEPEDLIEAWTLLEDDTKKMRNKPGSTWEQVTNRDDNPWERDRLAIDTALLGIDDSTELIRTVIGDWARSRRSQAPSVRRRIPLWSRIWSRIGRARPHQASSTMKGVALGRVGSLVSSRQVLHSGG